MSSEATKEHTTLIYTILTSKVLFVYTCVNIHKGREPGNEARSFYSTHTCTSEAGAQGSTYNPRTVHVHTVYKCILHSGKTKIQLSHIYMYSHM